MSNKRLDEVDLDVMENITGGCHDQNGMPMGEGGGKWNKAAAEAWYAQLQGNRQTTSGILQMIFGGGKADGGKPGGLASLFGSFFGGHRHRKA